MYSRCLVIFALILCLFGANSAYSASPILSEWEEYENNFDINAPSAFANINAPKGGAVVLSNIGTFDNFNGFAPRGTFPAYVFMTYETLGEAIPGTSGLMRGRLADSFDLSKDKRMLTVTINPKARFSDGTKVTAHDVVYTFNALIKEASPTYSMAYKEVEKVEAKSDSTVVFTFSKDASRQLPLNVCELPVLSKKWWEGKSMGEPQKEPYVGSGVYKIKSWDFGKQLIIERNKNYWAKDEPRNKGMANLDTITIDYYRDATVARQALFAGNIDYYSERSMNDWHEGYSNQPQVKNGNIQLAEFAPRRGVGMMGLAMNVRKPIMQNKDIRRALILLMDFEWLNKTMYYNSYQRTPSHFTGYDFAAPKTPSKDELVILNKYKNQLDPAVFGELPALPVSDGSGEMRAEMAQAVNLFKKAGWELKGGKMVNNKGEQLKITLIANSATVQKTYAQYAKTLERIGVNFVIQVLDQNIYTTKVKEYDFDMCYIFTPVGAAPGAELRYIIGSESADSVGTRNYIGIKNPVVDELIENVVKAKSYHEMQINLQAIDRILLHEMYFIPGWYSPQMRIAWWKDRSMPGKIDNIEFNSMHLYWYNSQK